MSGPQRVSDPSLPPPWQALYDPGSQLTYYWNPDTNHTQYERPAGGAGGAPPPAAASYGRDSYSNGRDYGATHGDANVSNGAGLNSYGGNVPSAGGVGGAGFIPVADYRKKHDLVVMGEGAPDPFQTFESVGFPHDIMDEVPHRHRSTILVTSTPTTPTTIPPPLMPCGAPAKPKRKPARHAGVAAAA
mmetsp:Transcript_15071/g.38279  ORF Transcript_15071/g.38279 Transcript_15071/m.38279 type:complete len:188 (-) Transcript_15071:1724-2287(-)